MVKVRMFCDWDNDSAELIERLKGQTVGFAGNDFRGMNFVSDDSYTHAICFNFPTYDLLTPARNNVALLLEPPELQKTMFAKERLRKYQNVRKIYSFTADDYEPAYGMGFAAVPDLDYPALDEKPNRVCMIASDKLMTPYHQKRQAIRNALLKTDLPIDFYGRGMQESSDPRVKGEIPPMAKHTILSQYQMCIDFENSPHCAVTDKFFDPVLCNTVPITNAAILGTLVDHDSFRFISFDLPVHLAVVDIEKAINSELNKEALLDAKREITSGSLSLANWIFDRVRESL